jgi:hypothetical protein
MPAAWRECCIDRVPAVSTTLLLLSRTSCLRPGGVKTVPHLGIAGDGRLDALADPRLASKRPADPREITDPLADDQDRRAELTMSRSLRALAIAQKMRPQ